MDTSSQASNVQFNATALTHWRMNMDEQAAISEMVGASLNKIHAVVLLLDSLNDQVQ